jgi:CRP/FNR family cyclic AMP-dependent transcriptional regulator
LSRSNGIATQLPEVELEPGPWPLLEDSSEGVGYLVTSGMLLRRVRVGGGRSVELLGAGDLLLPWREERASFACSEWEVVDRARLAVLDLRTGSPLTQSPTSIAVIAARAIDRSRALALQSAIMSIVGIEERLRTLLWAFAERWGRVVPDGVEIKVNVPQAVLAEMVGARRPTVSLALGALCDSGKLLALEPGRWVLQGEPPAIVTAATAA